MKISQLLCALLIVACLSNAFSSPGKQELLYGIEQSLQQNYTIALDHFEGIRQKYPNHPAGDLFLAIVLQTRMLDLETERWKEQFYHHLNRALDLADTLNPTKTDSIPLEFYIGTALSYKSYQLGRDHKYLPALQTGLKATNMLKKSYQQDSTFCDPLLGIGSYLYWKSRMTRHFHWLPFFSDDRQRGIQLIKKAYHCACFSTMAALSNLAWIFIEEKQYEPAIDYASIGLMYYPDSRFFRWPLAEAFFRQGNYQKALEHFGTILNSFEHEPCNNHYNEIVLWLKCAKCYQALGKKQKAREACKKVLEIEPAKEVKNRSKDKKKEAEKLLKTL
ncbi:tetratricopeptide repeat protein [candidate division KSB1 bacterium]|nr:tetratricopeptide repeat protein [candidate division KSB1 bacterium]